MKSSKATKYGYTSALLLLIGSAAHATTLYVHCGARSGDGSFTSIGGAIKALQSGESRGPATINVSGTCNENVKIKNTDRLTLNGLNGASIVDASSGNAPVVDINDSLGFTLQSFTIIAANQNNDAVSCYSGSHCLLISNNVQGGFNGIGVYPMSTAEIYGGSLSGNINGLNDRGDVGAAGVVIQGNTVGAIVQDGAKLTFRVSDPQSDPINVTLPAVSRGNQQQGILAARGATVRCIGCVVSNNGADGINLDLTSSVLVNPYFFTSGAVAGNSITGNMGSGVLVGDLSSATFKGNQSNISGNHQTDIFCVGQSSITRGAKAAVVAPASTNCTN